MGFTLPDSNSITDPQVKQFLERYYEASNNAEGHDDYTEFFAKDGEFAMNGKKAKGKDGKTGLGNEYDLMLISFCQRFEAFVKPSGPTSLAATTSPSKSIRTESTSMI